MNRQASDETFAQFGKALGRLKEVLQRSPDDDIVLDASIQRFEFTFELCWKALKKELAAEGIDATTPKAVLQQAYAANWLQEEQVWLNMLQDRNLTSHTYREEQARSIFAKLPVYVDEFQRVFSLLQERRRISEGFRNRI